MDKDTPLPAEVLEEIKRKANQFVKHTCYQHEMSIGRFSFEAGATEYATKLHQCDKANSALEEANRGLVEQNKEWKAKCARYEAALKEINRRAEYGRPVDLALGTKSGEMCIAIEIISRTALEDGKANEALSGEGDAEESRPEGWPFVCHICGKQNCESDHK